MASLGNSDSFGTNVWHDVSIFILGDEITILKKIVIFLWVIDPFQMGCVGTVLKSQQAPKEEKGLWMHRHKSLGLLTGMIVLPRVAYRLGNMTAVRWWQSEMFLFGWTKYGSNTHLSQHVFFLAKKYWFNKTLQYKVKNIAGVGDLEHKAASATHYLLYGFMTVMPGTLTKKEIFGFWIVLPFTHYYDLVLSVCLSSNWNCHGLFWWWVNKFRVLRWMVPSIIVCWNFIPTPPPIGLGKGLPFFSTTFSGIVNTEETKARNGSIAKQVRCGYFRYPHTHVVTWYRSSIFYLVPLHCGSLSLSRVSTFTNKLEHMENMSSRCMLLVPFSTCSEVM